MDKLDKQLQHSIRGEFELGWSLVQQLEKERPNCNRCAFNRGWYILRNGDLNKGMELISRGRWEKVFGSPPIGSGKPIFNPSFNDIRNKKVLLNLEGGLGDEIIGFRFAKEIYELGGKPIISCHPSLKFLFSNNNTISTIMDSRAIKYIEHDFWIPAMSAEYIFGYTYDTLPNKKYLYSNPAFVSKYSNIINSKKLKIGIRYVGNPEFEHEQHRLFPEKLLFDIFEDPFIKENVTVYSLQKDLGNKKNLPEHIIDMEHYLSSWDDTVGIIENMDLVISSCTSVAHASAALGKPTWIVIPILGYYIWAYQLGKDEISQGEYTSYYENTRVFRQEKYGKWEEPFENIKKGLVNIVNSRIGKSN